MTDPSPIAGLFPASVATACRRIGGDEPVLYPQEQAYLEKAIEKRRREFAAGRACAREALGRLGIAATPILRDERSAPRWPGGTVGAISHSHTWAGAAVARAGDSAGIGLDIETMGRVSMNIARKVLTPAEADRLAGTPESHRRQYLALVFSAKEAVYKCLAALVPVPLRFQDAEIRVTGPYDLAVAMGEAASRAFPACARIQGRYGIFDGCVFTGMFLAA